MDRSRSRSRGAYDVRLSYGTKCFLEALSGRRGSGRVKVLDFYDAQTVQS